jgi:glutamine synthetase
MAKYLSKFHGNSLGLKISLTDLEGNNISDEEIDKFAAGILKYTTDFACFYAPNVNSYKRFYENEIFNTWNKVGDNSNIQGVNILAENNTKKISFVIPGADTNPYLVLYSIIESGKLGLQQSLSTSKVENALLDLSIPTSLNKANKLFNASQAVKHSLGEEFHYHYNAFYSYEFEAYNSQVSLWELERYLYSI